MSKFKWQMQDHGLGGSMYCYDRDYMVAEAHGSGGRYSVKLHTYPLQPYGGPFPHDIYDPNDNIQKVIETRLLTGRWPSGIDKDQDMQDANINQGNILNEYLGDDHASIW